MKILIESFNNVCQNPSGGIQVRINKFMQYLNKKNIEVKLYNKWEDKLTDFDLLHIFKVNLEDYDLLKLAKKKDIPVVISSIIPLEKRVNIVFNRLLCKLLPIHTGYWFINEMLTQSNAIIAQTNKEADFIKKYYGVEHNKIHVIPNGVNIEIDKNNKKIFPEKTGINSRFVLQVGRFDKNKNQLNIIKALNNSEIPVVFIGGPDPNEIEYYEECKRIAGQNFHFLGWIKHDDPLLSSAYQNAHVVILPSYKEIFGNSLIEGGAAGANLVATKELPIKEWGLSEFCKTINPNDTNDIFRKVVQAYNEPLDERIKEIITCKFSWENVINQHIFIYKQIIDRGR